MQVTVAAIGKLKKGPEQELVARYQARCQQQGKPLGLTMTKPVELGESRASSAEQRKAEEARALMDKLGDDCALVVFDERGKRPSSREFAMDLRKLMESGTRKLGLVIGGPDGLDDGLRQRADHVVAFGSLTMPHQIVRILVLEQLYRTTTIWANHPYHRD